MLSPLLLALTSALLSPSVSSAAVLPSRTHCRCTITTIDSDSAYPSPPTTYRDSLLNPDTLIPTTPTPPDLCTALGPSLSNLRVSNPALYESYVSKSRTEEQREESKTDEEIVAAATQAQRPVSTTVLLRLAAQQGFQNLGVVFPAVGGQKEQQQRENQPPAERIECRTEIGDEAWSGYQVSWVTLVVLQVVVALVVVACVAEGVMFGLRWYVLFSLPRYQSSNNHTNPQTRMSTRTLTPRTLISVPVLGRPSGVRLPGEEKRLLAIPVSDATNDVRSPGIEKKLRAYASPGWKVHRFAYMEDEDDEFNRPVM